MKNVELIFDYLEYLLGNREVFYPQEQQAFREFAIGLFVYLLAALMLQIIF